MPQPSAISPNTGNYQVGKGTVSFKKNGESTYRDVGNVTSMVITPEVSTLEHFSSREGVKKKDLVVILEKKAVVKMTLDEFTPENVALMILGDVDMNAVNGPIVEIFSTNAVQGALRFVGTNEIGPKVTVDLYNVSFAPTGDFNLISDEWNNMDLTGDVLVDGAAGPTFGQFGKIQYTNLVADVQPDVVSIAPTTGVAAGGTAVVITGTGFLGASAVSFGGTAATTFNVVNDTTINATTPAHAAGAVAVMVTDSLGTDTLAASYTYT